MNLFGKVNAQENKKSDRTQHDLRDIITTLIDIELRRELPVDDLKQIKGNQFSSLITLLKIELVNNPPKTTLLHQALSIYHWRSINVLIAYYGFNEELSPISNTRNTIQQIELQQPVDNFDRVIMETVGQSMIAYLKSQIADELLEQARIILSQLNTSSDHVTSEKIPGLLKALDILIDAAELNCPEAKYEYWMHTKNLSLLESPHLHAFEATLKQAAAYLVELAKSGHNGAMLELAYCLAFNTNNFKGNSKQATKYIKKIETDIEFARANIDVLSLIKLQINYKEPGNGPILPLSF